MRICHFIASYGYGGAERVVVDLANGMSQEHEVHLVFFGGEESIRQLSSNVIVHQIPRFSRHNPLGRYRLKKLLYRIDADIVHTHGAKATQLVDRFQGVLPSTFVATKHNARKGKIFNKQRYVIAVSLDVKESILGAEKVEVIHNGIVPVPIKRSIPHDEAVKFLAIGRLDAIKGFDTLIEACSRLSRPFSLEIIGEGSEREKLQAQIKQAGLEHCISLPGFCSNIPQRMAEADCVVMSSHSEGFSMVMVESLFYANCFLSTKVSGATEILPRSFLTTHAALSDKLDDFILKCEDYQESFRAEAKRIRSSFLLSKVIEKHLSFYRSIMLKEAVARK